MQGDRYGTSRYVGPYFKTWLALPQHCVYFAEYPIKTFRAVSLFFVLEPHVGNLLFKPVTEEATKILNPMEETTDLEKLSQAFSKLTSHFSSTEDFLSAFGVNDLPIAHRYGIFYGTLVFVLTVTAVLALLVMGGSFDRIAEQAKTGDIAVSDPITSRTDRNLILERLVDARDRMMKENYRPPETSSNRTKLMDMILNISLATCVDISELTDEDEKKRNKQQKFIPPGYHEDYVDAYKVCQDTPGGAAIPGRPEARFESYARSFAGCGRHVTREYRRSYARMYEMNACKSHATDNQSKALYASRPEDLIGRLVRLEALEIDRHAKDFHDLSCGEAHLEHKPYNPKEIWAFLNYGPFKNVEELKESPIFVRKMNEAGFAIVENVSNRMIGVVLLNHDDPENLKISFEVPVVMPSFESRAEPIEACFLILDKLFALGYRRVELAVDSQDAARKRVASRLGFTKEATIPKHMVVKDANRDSIIYGMLNSDWTKGARNFLYKKLHGAKLLKLDENNNKKENEREERARLLAEKKNAEKNGKGN
eukprot:CAMPEP_0178906700 /NCGR_PEP_ID=MMETSP0786-20121207/6967_1 /TAXON_ID=186022 /ORGANISM="Thalassionema frauenfeldii, Strain CCMP 1798" /LENGTH=538 /DNA_ID=CAMNT_0020578429 /DNA_START=280 /DNA_END=1893 /DNA_ORIENTATION=+